MSYRKLSLFVALLMLAGFGCGEDEGPTDIQSASLAPADFDVPVSDSSAPLPVWQTEAEVAEHKADRFDVRGSYRDIYGTTSAPMGAVRSLAEFERTDGVLIDWDGWLDEFMLEMTRAVASSSPVFIMTDSVRESNSVRSYLERNGVDTTMVQFFEFRNEAFWTRDYGPVPIVNASGTPAFVDQEYYPNRRRDDAVPTLMSRYFGVDVYRPQLATEGGNFMTNGEGLCVATEWIWQGNPGLSEREIDNIKRDYYGCNDLVVVERLAGEGTGHVDMFAKFVTRNTVLVGEYRDSSQATNAAILDRNARRLSNVRLSDGSRLNVVRMPMPSADHPVYRSYTNSLIVNDTVVVPVYAADRRFEDEALRIYEEVMPAGYDIVPVVSDEVIELGGAIHCTTMGFALGQVNGPMPVEPAVEPEPEPGFDQTVSSQPGVSIEDLTRVSERSVACRSRSISRIATSEISSCTSSTTEFASTCTDRVVGPNKTWSRPTRPIASTARRWVVSGP